MAYTAYLLEDILADNSIYLKVERKSNFKRPYHPCTKYIISVYRNKIETAFNDIAKYMPEKIYAVTKNEFLIKLIMFI